MSAIFVWVHAQEAKLYHLKAKSIHVETVRTKNRRLGDAPFNTDFLEQSKEDESLFRQLARTLKKKEAALLLIMGPTSSAQHFQRHLQNHHPDLAAQVIGVERVELMPDSEVLSKGRQFLHQYYMQKIALA